ncbi:MAG: hypothetical protein JJ900_11030 [Rhodospirillales bacterium]|nr:hypothetical protein [Rhodospirillales bacterium]
MMDGSDDLRKRRDALETVPAPHPRHDAVVVMENDCMGARLRLRYVPDRDVLKPESLSRYVGALARMPFTSLEETAQTILEDINDQVIPNWIEVTLSRIGEEMRHEVRVEDRQPNWKERGLLDRLAP